MLKLVTCQLFVIWHACEWYINTHGPSARMLRSWDAEMPRCWDAASWTLSISPSASRALSRISGVLSGDVHARFLGPTFRSALHSHSFRCFACFLSAKFIASFVSGHYLYEYVSVYRATPLWRFSFSYFPHCQWYIIGQVVVVVATSPHPIRGLVLAKSKNDIE